MEFFVNLVNGLQGSEYVSKMEFFVNLVNGLQSSEYISKSSLLATQNKYLRIFFGGRSVQDKNIVYYELGWNIKNELVL